MHTSIILTISSFSQVFGVGFYADKSLHFESKCYDKSKTYNEHGISRDSKIEGLFLDDAEYRRCDHTNIEKCNEQGRHLTA